VQTKLKSIIKSAALPKQMPDGALNPVLSVAQIEELAIRFGIEGKSIEIIALENGIFPERYLRNFKSFTLGDQIRLLQSKVTVIGLGGLGGTVTEWLARAGVGDLNLIDGDRFEDHNLNRQLLCTQEQLGSSKARAAAERVCRINSSVTVQAHTEFIGPQNGARLVEDCHIVADCLDDIRSRLIVEQACKAAGVPMISAAVAGQTGHLTTIFPEDRGLELIYGPVEALKSTKGAETILGNLPSTVGLIASIESAEIIKVLLGRQEQVLRNKMLVADLESHSYEIMRLI
jgi:molybdopterin/thiamine biosynthesis adenylyltransferase